LQIGDVVGPGRRKLALSNFLAEEAGPVGAGHAGRLGRIARQRGEHRRVEEHERVGALQLHAQLVDIGFAPAERGGQRQRDRPGPGIDGAEEERAEFGRGLGNERDPVAGLHAARDQAAGAADRVGLQLGIRISPLQLAAGVVEVETAPAVSRIVQRFAKGGEVGEPADTAVVGRGRHGLGRAFTACNHFWLDPYKVRWSAKPRIRSFLPATQ
jgi:hypothetical protein